MRARSIFSSSQRPTESSPLSATKWGCGYVAAYAAAGVVPWSGFFNAVVHYWIGDAIGIIVLVPPILTLTRPKEQWGRPIAIGSGFSCSRLLRRR